MVGVRRESVALLRGEVAVLQVLLRREDADRDDAHERPSRIGVVDPHPQRDATAGVGCVLARGKRQDGSVNCEPNHIHESLDDVRRNPGEDIGQGSLTFSVSWEGEMPRGNLRQRRKANTNAPFQQASTMEQIHRR